MKALNLVAFSVHTVSVKNRIIFRIFEFYSFNLCVVLAEGHLLNLLYVGLCQTASKWHKNRFNITLKLLKNT